jgi:hypothetical protein
VEKSLADLALADLALAGIDTRRLDRDQQLPAAAYRTFDVDDVENVESAVVIEPHGAWHSSPNSKSHDQPTLGALLAANGTAHRLQPTRSPALTADPPDAETRSVAKAIVSNRLA